MSLWWTMWSSALNAAWRNARSDESGAAFSAAAVSDYRRLPSSDSSAELKTASRIPPGRMAPGLFWPQVGLKMAQVASKLPLTCHLAGHVAANLLQDASGVA